MKKNLSLKKAWNIMQEANVVTIPAVTEEGLLEGLITVGDIAKSYMNVYDSSILSKANTQYANIVETLKCAMIVGMRHRISARARFSSRRLIRI